MSIKDFREYELKMGIEELATKMNISIDELKEAEENPNQVNVNFLIALSTMTGKSIDEIAKYEKPLSFTVENKWENIDINKRDMLSYIKNRRRKYNESYEKDIIEVYNQINLALKKPKIGFVGSSDTGKSTLINSLIGVDKMPANWTPTTAIAIYIKHIDDRPKFIQDEAWIFKAGNWDVNKIEDEKYCKSWKLESGDASILKSYGTRQGDKYENNEAGSAVIFIDSSILKNCDIVDLPGFGTGDRVEDDEITFNAKLDIDGLIYLSISNGFMRENDINYLKESINSLKVIEHKNNKLKPLSNLFIVASQAKSVNNGNEEKLNMILDEGCKRLMKSMPSTFFDNRSNISGYNYDYKVLRDRFFTYEKDINDLKLKFQNELKTTLEEIPSILHNESKGYIYNVCEDIIKKVKQDIKRYSEMKEKKELYEEIVNNIEKNELQRVAENQKRVENIFRKIISYNNDSANKFNQGYNRILSQDYIVDTIEYRNFKKKQDDIETLVSLLNSELEEELQIVLKEGAGLLKSDIDKFINDFKIDIDSKIGSIDIDFGFDYTKAFLAGLAGLATYGGLTAWASTLGNLGAYILVAKGVSVLAALGISIPGGVAGAAAGIAGIGGPVVIGIGIAVIATIGVFALLSGGWKSKISKKIIKSFDENQALDKYIDVINKYWNDTEVEFKSCVDHMDNEFTEHVSKMKKDIENYKNIDEEIAMAKDFNDFILKVRELVK